MLNASCPWLSLAATRAVVPVVVMWLTACLPALAQAPPIRFAHLSLGEGLSQATVLSVHQDRRGFLWVGTEDGLNRFDGRQFVVYRRRDGDATSLPGNVVWSLAEDRDGHLWVGTEDGGVARWNHQTDAFERLTGSRGAVDMATLAVRAIHFDRGGSLWVGTRSAGLVRVTLDGRQIATFAHQASDPGSLTDDHVYAITTDRRGHLWVGTDGGLDRFDPATRTFAHYRDAGAPGRLPTAGIRQLLPRDDGTLWVGTSGAGLARLATDSGRATVYRHDPLVASSLSHDEVRALLVDASGRLWVGTSEGLNLLDQATGRFTRYRQESGSATTLSDEHVMSLAQDRSGMLWVGTRSGGLNGWHESQWRFGHTGVSTTTTAAGLSHRTVTSFAEDEDGRLWVGTFGGGLNVMDRATGTVRHHRETDGDQGPGDDRVMALLHDRRGRLWVGTYGAGLSRFDPSTGRFVRYRHDPTRPDSLGHDAVSTIFEDRVGRIWVGTFGGGLNRLDPATGTFRRYAADAGRPDRLSSARITCIAEDGHGLLWVGTDGAGLNRLAPDSGHVERLTHDPRRAGGLAAATIFSVFIDARDDVWIGTQGGGLNRLSAAARPLASAVLARYGVEQGLTNQVVYGIEPETSGRLWLSTNNGLFRFEPQSGRFEAFTESDGLQAREFSFGAHHRGVHGELFFGGINGFNAFRPESIQSSTKPMPVVLTGMRVFGQPRRLPAPPFASSHLALAYQDDVVTLDFAALDFSAPETTRYAYQLEGFDPRWIVLGRDSTVTLTDLAPGRYVLRVKAAQGAPQWETVPGGLALTIDAQAPPWQRWWAYASYTLGGAGLMVAVVGAQRRKLRREEAHSRRLEREVQARTAELAAQNEQLAGLNIKLLETSVTDALTGLHNRRFLFERVVKEVASREEREGRKDRAEDGAGYEIVFVMIDLDGFKPINDTFGHPAGDEVLVQVVARLTTTLRPTDELIRWGGDEFLVMLRHTTRAGLTTVAARIRQAIGCEPYTLSAGQSRRLTCSIGFAAFATGATTWKDWESVLALADVALYRAKAMSRDAWVGYFGDEECRLSGVAALTEPAVAALVAEGTLTVVDSTNARA